MASVLELSEKKAEFKVIDCRTLAEFEEVRVPGVIHLPLSEIEARNFPDYLGDDEFYYVICRSGKRSERACQILSANGIGKPENVDGGTLAWIEAGFTTESS